MTACFAFCAGRRIGGACVLAPVAVLRARRTGLSPSARSIKVLTATAVSTMAGKAHAVAGVYPMASIRSRRATKLTANAPAPMVAVALTAQK